MFQYLIFLVFLLFPSFSSDFSFSSAPAVFFVSGGNATCVTANFGSVSGDSYCGNLVNWLVPDSLNIAGSDASARAFGANVDSCPYFLYRPYICAKYFPLCQDSTIIKVCQSDCFDGKYANSRQCQYFSDQYFTDECGQLNYYSAPPICRHPPTLSESNDSYYWKIGLGVGLFCGAGLLGGFLIRKRCRENMTAEQLDAEYKRKEEKKAAEARKIRERNAAAQQQGQYGNMPEEDPVPASPPQNGAELARVRIAAQKQKELERQIEAQRKMEEKWAAEAAARQSGAIAPASDGYQGTRVLPPESADSNFI